MPLVNLTAAAPSGLLLFTLLIFKPDYWMNTDSTALSPDSHSYQTKPTIWVMLRWDMTINGFFGLNKFFGMNFNVAAIM